MNVETEAVWFTTGNPFVDTGQEMMAAMAEVNSAAELSTADVRVLLPRLVDLYFQEGWLKDSYSIFPNSDLNNGNNRRKRYTDTLDNWLLAVEESDSYDLGNSCVVSGRPAQVHLGRKYLPMSDSEEGNFQSGNQKGVPLSASVALALQFLPLGLVWVGRMVAFPHFSNAKLQSAWADQQIDNVLTSEALSTGGVRSLGTPRPVNAFFKLVEELMHRQRESANSSVTLYLFNNYNVVNFKNAAELHYMPSPVFRFVASAVNHQDGKPWRQIVKRGYVTKKEIEDEDEALRRYDNRVYSKLLRDESISEDFLDRRQRRPVVRGDGGWRLFGSYLKEVRGMDKRRVDNLRDLGDRIAPLVRDKTRRLVALEDTRSRGALTDVLYSVSKDAMRQGQDRPLVTFDQLVTDVFPHDAENSDWREVKYLLLFRIYEQLFDDLKGNPEYVRTEPEGENGAA